MDYSNEILEFLSQNTDFCEIILAPGAIPVQRVENAVEAIGSKVLSSVDVADTLVSFAANAPGEKKVLLKEGVFSFGFPTRGRFRVSYMTQRGSYVLSVVKVPLEVPLLRQLIFDPTILQQVESTFYSYSRGLLAVSGPSSLLTNTFVYSLLRGVNDSQSRLVLVLERAASFLLKHGKSIILQMEIGSDVADLERGLKNAMTFNPDILYVRDVTNREELMLAQKFAENRTVTVVTMSALDAEKWFFKGQFGRDSWSPNTGAQPVSSNLGQWQVSPAPIRGQISVRFNS